VSMNVPEVTESLKASSKNCGGEVIDISLRWIEADRDSHITDSGTVPGYYHIYMSIRWKQVSSRFRVIPVRLT
jgi:hypothetical protein